MVVRYCCCGEKGRIIRKSLPAILLSLRNYLLTMLEVTDLSCERDRRQLFSSLSFSLAEGELLQLIGGNSSGKSAHSK